MNSILTLKYRLPALNATMHSTSLSIQSGNLFPPPQPPLHPCTSCLSSSSGTSPVDEKSVSEATSSISHGSIAPQTRSSPHCQGLAQPPATSTHSAKHEPCFPSTSTMSVSHLHLHPTPFSFTVSQESQYSSSSFRFFSSRVVNSRNGDRGI